MATGQLNGVLHSLQRAALWHGTEALTDADLLACFIAGKDESAFAGLVRRHGPMVFSVCRRVLGNIHDAEDAFQAAFLVLARKAASIWPRALVGNWLYGVAYRTALRAKSMIARRQAREKQVSELPDCAAPTASPWSNLWPLLDRELHALADKYRVPVILCDLEGQSQREAARQLGWPEGTLMTRLARARRMLAKRLNRRGVALSAGALATLLAQNTLSAAVPAPLALATVKAATFVAAGPATAVVSAEVAALTEGVLSTMFFAKIKSAALVLFVVAVLGSGAGFFAHRSLADRSAAAEPTPAAERPVGAADFTALAEQDRGDRKPDPNAANFRGKIVAVAKGGKSITIETPATERGGAPVKHDLKLTDKTEVKFFGVGLGGAKLAEGLQAQIWR